MTIETIEIFCNIVTAGTSIVAIILASYTFRVQTLQANTTLGITILNQYSSEFFDSPEYRRRRYITAQFLLTRKPGDPPPTEALDLLDFFDGIGFHLRRRVIDLDMTWSYFFYWFSHYWYALAIDAETFRKSQGGVAYHDNAVLLDLKLTQFALKHKGLSQAYLTSVDSRLETFLKDEMNSCVEFLPPDKPLHALIKNPNTKVE